MLSNRRWLTEHLPKHGGGPLQTPSAQAAAPGPRAALPDQRQTIAMDGFTLSNEPDGLESDWGNIFDAGDEAVQIDLRDKKRRS